MVESNIHYPTDVSLLWDAWRVQSRAKAWRFMIAHLSAARDLLSGARAAILPVVASEIGIDHGAVDQFVDHNIVRGLDALHDHLCGRTGQQVVGPLF